MYPFVLAVHNIVRWIVLLLGVWAVYCSASGWLGKRPWTASDRKAGVYFSSAFDTQLLLGLVLYFFLSPITRAALADFGAVMGDSGLRFFAIEHTLFMLVGVVLVHLGSILPKKAAMDNLKHQRAFIFFGLALVILLLGTPWMRPLLPGF
jgi:hypothetical protein